jgi:hypothetical protein
MKRLTTISSSPIPFLARFRMKRGRSASHGFLPLPGPPPMRRRGRSAGSRESHLTFGSRLGYSCLPLTNGSSPSDNLTHQRVPTSPDFEFLNPDHLRIAALDPVVGSHSGVEGALDLA